MVYCDSHAAFSHLLRVYCDTVHEDGAGVVSPDALAILLHALFSLAELQCQETDPAGLSWLGLSPYYFAYDLAGFTK